MEVGRNIEFLLKKAAQSAARAAARDKREEKRAKIAGKRMDKLLKGFAQARVRVARLKRQIKQADVLLSASIRAAGHS